MNCFVGNMIPQRFLKRVEIMDIKYVLLSFFHNMTHFEEHSGSSQSPVARNFTRSRARCMRRSKSNMADFEGNAHR